MCFFRNLNNEFLYRETGSRSLVSYLIRSGERSERKREQSEVKCVVDVVIDGVEVMGC